MNRPFRRLISHSEHSPEESAERVIATLEYSGLDSDTTLVIGGAALALAGIRPAGDVDVMVPFSVYTQLLESRLTPSEVRVTPESHDASESPFVTVQSSHEHPGILSIDITKPFEPWGITSREELDAKLLSVIEQSEAFGGYRYLSPEIIAAHKRQNTNFHNLKARRDIRLISHHLKSQNK
jgi:hypothetical protein